MSVSRPSLTSLPASASAGRRGNRGVVWTWLLAAALMLAYIAPWMMSGSAALTFGGYDLGEWASLPPGVRSQTPPLVASFLLRLPLTLITLYLACIMSYRRFTSGWLLTGVACLLLVLAQLPPLEFFTLFRGDPNYGQQATLALVSFAGALAGLVSAQGRWRWLVAAVLAAVGAVTSVAGALSARELMVVYQIGAKMGAAVWLTTLLFVVAAVWAAFRFVRSFLQG